MPLIIRSLKDAVAERFGWRRAYRNPTEIDKLLAKQSEAIYTNEADHGALATARNTSALAVQPGVLDARGRILAEVLYLEGLLTGARNRGLDPELIEGLEEVIDRGHELTMLLADVARTTATATSTAAAHAGSGS